MRTRTPTGCCGRCSPTTDKLAEFDREHEVDFAYAVEGLARFRVNAFRQRGGSRSPLRVIPFAVRTIDELGLPPVMQRDRRRGTRPDPADRDHRLR